jgi:uncharacterized BrkB/YihY/UPF0761 family membrane protein
MNTQNGGDERSRPQLPSGGRPWLLLRGFAPLALLAAALLAGPTLLAWWLRGGSFGWDDALIGGVASAVLLAALALVFGWAVGRIGRGRPNQGRRTKNQER